MVEYFIDRYGKQTGKTITPIGNITVGILRGYDWAGNIRELQNVVERGVVLSERDTFDIDESWLNRESPPCATASQPSS